VTLNPAGGETMESENEYWWQTNARRLKRALAATSPHLFHPYVLDPAYVWDRIKVGRGFDGSRKMDSQWEQRSIKRMLVQLNGRRRARKPTPECPYLSLEDIAEAIECERTRDSCSRYGPSESASEKPPPVNAPYQYLDGFQSQGYSNSTDGMKKELKSCLVQASESF